MEASVIIPTYNRADKLRNCLRALSCQTHPATDFEVVVVIDGSTDGTLAMLASLPTPFSLRVVEQPNLGQPTALNHGVAESIGRVSIFLDDDMVVTPEFVTEHLRLHQQHDMTVGIGHITLTLPSHADWFARGFARGWSDHYEELNQGIRQPDWDDCYGGNMSAPRAAVLAIEGNVTDLKRGYDVELAYRLKQHGCSFQYLPNALGNQDESKGLRELAKDSELAGEGTVKLALRHPATAARLLGHWMKTPWTWLFVWQLLFLTNVSEGGMERLRRFVGKRGQSYGWFIFVNQYYFWKGVRRAAPEKAAWRQMTQFQKRGHFA